MLHVTPLLRSGATGAMAPAAVRSPVAGITAWLADVQRRIGIRLFLTADEEACWRGWRITERWGGLARGYRDARFEPGAGQPAEDRNTGR